MSYIPNCREDENYNGKYLNETDKEFLRGFDWAVEQAVDNFFDNNFEIDFGEDDDYLTHVLTQKLPEGQKKEYDMEDSFTESGEIEYHTVKVETYADLLRMKILEWCESGRNELIVSMIENMDEKEYESIKKRVDEQQQ
jgi:hypothetical protein